MHKDTILGPDNMGHMLGFAAFTTLLRIMGTPTWGAVVLSIMMALAIEVVQGLLWVRSHDWRVKLETWFAKPDTLSDLIHDAIGILMATGKFGLFLAAGTYAILLLRFTDWQTFEHYAFDISTIKNLFSDIAPAIRWLKRLWQNLPWRRKKS